MRLVGVEKAESVNKFRILLRLLWKGLTARKRRDITDVKGYYTNEQYDWITDTKFPEKILHDRRRDTMSEKIQAYIKYSKVLDLGCGTGLITQLLPGEVIGVDISPWKVRRAQQHCPHALFVVGDIENLPELAGNYFDAVVCTDVLEHLERPDKAVTEAWRVLKPKGIFIGTVPSRHAVWKLRRFLTTADASGEPFHIHYTKGKLQQLLCPFNVLEISTQCLGLELFFAATKEESTEVKVLSALRGETQLTALYASLTVGLIGFSLLAYILPPGMIWSMMALLCFLLIIFAFVLDAAIEKVKGWRRR